MNKITLKQCLLVGTNGNRVIMDCLVTYEISKGSGWVIVMTIEDLKLANSTCKHLGKSIDIMPYIDEKSYDAICDQVEKAHAKLPVHNTLNSLN